MIGDIADRLPRLKTTEDFSGSCGAQYKNRNNVLNLCMHHKDFSVNAQWKSFATSHGKQPCDGTGESIKCLTCKGCLQHSLSN